MSSESSQSSPKQYDYYNRMSLSGRDRSRLLSQLKKNYSIWPLLVFAFGCAPAMITFMAFHKGTNPETIWTTNNSEPWNAWKNRREKLLSFVDLDYKNYKTGRPEFDYPSDDKK